LPALRFITRPVFRPFLLHELIPRTLGFTAIRYFIDTNKQSRFSWFLDQGDAATLRSMLVAKRCRCKKVTMSTSSVTGENQE
jgi:hypothetical protein